jgi:predicted phage terminase large subunit-like protein
VVSTPPRHGKTECLIHGIAYLLAADPTLQLSYIGYAATFAEDKSRKAREIARAAGVPISPDAWARKNWRTGAGDGGLWATSIDGPVTGQGFHVMVVDDPVKDRAAAESAVQREHVYSWFTDTAFTRLEPNGSCIVVQTRWHPDDLVGRLIGDGWECVNLPAIDKDGRALWPERWPIEQLREIEQQLGDYGWNSLYQGEPRGRGSSVFHDAVIFERPPANLARVCIGLDFAYTAKTHADYSVAVVMVELGGFFHVIDVVRVQEEPRVFRQRVANLHALYPNATAYAHVAGTEQGSVEFIREAGIPIVGVNARADKFTRALPAAACWNSGGIKVPKSAPWLDAFLAEVCGFTGVKDRHDDQVDALAAAYDGLRHTTVDWRFGEELNAAFPKAVSW